jgi:hypothetical protein
VLARGPQTPSHPGPRVSNLGGDSAAGGSESPVARRRQRRQSSVIFTHVPTPPQPGAGPKAAHKPAASRPAISVTLDRAFPLLAQFSGKRLFPRVLSRPERAPPAVPAGSCVEPCPGLRQRVFVAGRGDKQLYVCRERGRGPGRRGRRQREGSARAAVPGARETWG